MGDCDDLLPRAEAGSVIFPRVEMKSWKFWKVQMQQHFAILPWGFRSGMGSLRVLAALHSANCGVLLF